MQVLKDEIRQGIVRAAKELFLQKGFEATSVNMIARRAGVSKSNLYNYFSSKENIYYYLTESAYTAIEGVLDNLFSHKPDDNIDAEEYAALASRELGRLLTQYREEIILIVDCSLGTRYKDAKEEFISRVQEHIIMELTEFKILDANDDYFFAHYVATSMVEGLLEIIRHNKSDSWIRNNIQLFVNYHVSSHCYFLTHA